MLKNRLKPMLAAGVLTGLVLTTVLALSWRDAKPTNDPTRIPTAVAAAPPANTLQAENTQLRTAIATLQARETEYHRQIEAANRAIVKLQETAIPARYDEDDDDHGGYRDKHREKDDD